MISFSSDVDILRYEPALFSELYAGGQVLAEGTSGELSGTTFTAAGADFVSARIEAGGVIYLRGDDGLLDMSAEIVSVDSATALSVSVVRADSEGDAIAPPGASDISYRISTFSPQASDAGKQLAQHFGLSEDSDNGGISVDGVIEKDVLRQVSVFAVISGVYAMLASRDGDEHFWKKSLYYRKLFEKARERCCLEIDSGSDGVADTVLIGGCGKLGRG